MSANGLAAEAVTQLRVNRKEEMAQPPPLNAAAIDNALSALSMYIPAEAMALYLAISSSLPAITGTSDKEDPKYVLWGHVMFWSFVVCISPGLFLLAYFAKLAKSNSGLPTRRELPYFRFLASAIAFGFWGLCVPGNPFAAPKDTGAGVLFGFLATLVSIVLPSTEAIFNWVLDIRRGRVGEKKDEDGDSTTEAGDGGDSPPPPPPPADTSGGPEAHSPGPDGGQGSGE
jgi:hypothetical protein